MPANRVFVNIGNRVAVSRKAFGKTQEELAVAAGVSRRTISTIESGLASDLSLAKVLKVLSCLGLTLQVGFDSFVDPALYKDFKSAKPIHSDRLLRNKDKYLV